MTTHVPHTMAARLSNRLNVARAFGFVTVLQCILRPHPCLPHPSIHPWRTAAPITVWVCTDEEGEADAPGIPAVVWDHATTPRSW